MPEISRFLGIVIAMFYDDHNPPHFHARYGSNKVEIDIRTLAVLAGHFPPKALGLVMEWPAFTSTSLCKIGNWRANRRSSRRLHLWSEHVQC